MNQSKKRATVVSKTILTDAIGHPIGVTFDFPTMGRREIVSLNALSNAIGLRLMAHGLSQKVGDAAAMSRNPETGMPANDEDKVRACLDVIRRLRDGDWNAEREGGGNVSYLFKALCRMYEGKKTPVQLQAWLDKLDDTEKLALMTKNPAVAKTIAEIRAEKVADVFPPSLDELDEDDEEDEGKGT